MKFKVGNRVLIHESSRYKGQNTRGNEIYEGTVIGTYDKKTRHVEGTLNRFDFDYRVKWDNNVTAAYNDQDLIAVISIVENNRDAVKSGILDKEW